LAVTHAVGEYILFIDDDEIASPEWIINIYNTLIKYKADAVFGQVVSYFEEGTPDWIKNCFVYNRPAPATGTIAVSTRTGNVIVKSSLLKLIPGPFDPEYGITGGSDTKLFSMLKEKGAKYINCHEALTYEYVPEKRAKIKWLIIRAFRTGNNFVRRQVESKSKSTLFIKIKYLIVGITYSVTSIILTLIFFFNKTKRVNWVLKFFANLGKLSAITGYRPIEY
jgi:succinoglycan biosynthesis protein ExoM